MGAAAVSAQDVPTAEPQDTVLLDSLGIQETGPAAPEEVDRPYVPPPPPNVPMRKLEARAWDEATEGLDYSKDLPKKEKPRESRSPDMSDWNVNTAGIANVLQVIAIALALMGIAYAIFRTLQSPRNRKIGQAGDGIIITAENVDAYIHETDLERFLRTALEAGDYSLALRIYYLQVIKQLSEKNMIRWSREKTNRDYLRETREQRFHKSFREATLHFEKVWYGNERLDAAGYKRLEPGFRSLMAEI